MPTHIAATGSAETRVAPDRATVTIAVRTTSPESPSDAARAMAPIERAVIDAVVSAGVSRADVATLRYDAGREKRFEKQSWVVGDHYVEHILSATVERLDALGAVVAAARRAGATRIAGVHFWLSDDEAHRLTTLGAAVAQARARAEAIASAAGARLGPIVRLGTPEALAATLGAAGDGGYGGPMPHAAAHATMLRATEDDEPEPLILPVPVTVAVVVHGAWEAADA